MLEELDYQRTELGELILRRRESVSQPGLIVYEVTLGGEFLMSSVVNDSEIALTRLGLAALPDGPWDVLVGGLGLGYTAAAALEHPKVRRVVVLELLEPVLAWHRQHLVPLGAALSSDPRCELRQGDFFEVARTPPRNEGERFDAVLVDIDHSPESLLQPAHAAFYAREGIENFARLLRPGGVLALWSADDFSPAFVDQVRRVFSTVELHQVSFQNPFLGEEDSNWVLVARL